MVVKLRSSERKININYIKAQISKYIMNTTLYLFLLYTNNIHIIFMILNNNINYSLYVKYELKHT